MKQTKIKIDFYHEDIKSDILTASMRAYMKRALIETVKLFGIDYAVQVTVGLVDAVRIMECNRENRGIDSVTDVLSFPLLTFSEGCIDESLISDGECDEDGNVMLGDVMICSAVAVKQAEEYGHSVERETVYLFVHSVLHLLGFDHEKAEDKKHMRSAEEKIMNKIGLSRDE